MKPVAKDARGMVLGVGDFVCYTVSSRGSGLEFGYIHKISEKVVKRYRWDYTVNPAVRTTYDDIEFYIVVNHTDAFGKAIYKTEWDPYLKKSVPTDKQSRSGRIEHYESKFIRL